MAEFKNPEQIEDEHICQILNQLMDQVKLTHAPVYIPTCYLLRLIELVKTKGWDLEPHEFCNQEPKIDYFNRYYHTYYLVKLK